MVEELYLQRRRAWEAALVTAQNFLETIADEILEDVDRDRLNAQTARIKDPGRSADKLRRYLSEGRITEPTDADAVAEALPDLVGVKVLCKTPRDQLTFVAALERACNDPECSVRFAQPPTDYVAFPKPSGYRAYHAVLVVRVATHQGDLDVKVEVQVKTRLQDAWGELTHEDMYKPGEALKPTKKHTDYAAHMAHLLDQVDAMADDLAAQLDSLTAASKDGGRARGRPDSEGSGLHQRQGHPHRSTVCTRRRTGRPQRPGSRTIGESGHRLDRPDRRQRLPRSGRLHRCGGRGLRGCALLSPHFAAATTQAREEAQALTGGSQEHLTSVR